MTIKAVIFDLDGTVASFNLDYRIVRAEVRDFLIRTGVPASILNEKESVFEMLNKTEAFIECDDKNGRKLEETREKALLIAERYELEAAKNTSLLPGVPETLTTLRNMNLKIGLCTINSKESTDYILERFGIKDSFDAVIPRNMVRHVKPNSEHLEAVLKALRVDLSEAIVVGDGNVDMKCARKLSVIAIGVPTGVCSSKDLVDSGANFIITSIADLPCLIEQMNKA